MARNLLIKNVSDATAEKLRLRAKANHRSLQDELMALIESSVSTMPAAFCDHKPIEKQKLTLRDIAERISNRYPSPIATPKGMSAAEAIRQMRDR